MTNSAHIPQEDLAMYAMQALGAEEAAPIRLHLAQCAECRAVLAEISGDLALVAMSAEMQPLPQGARERFLDRMGAVPAPVAAAKVVKMEKPHAPAKPVVTRSTGGWLGWAAAAALLIVSVGLGVQLRIVQGELQRESALNETQRAESRRAREVLNVLTAPTAQHVLLTAGEPHPAPSARAVYLASRGALVLQASNLKPLESGKTYELWLIPTKGTPIPAGLFRPDAAGSADVVLPQLPQGVEAKAFGVTVEREGGSATPTLPIVLAGAAGSAGE